MNSPSRSNCKHGFVLLSVIVVLVVVGVILVRMASQGLQLTLAAKVRADQLQEDWAVQSAERAILPQASRLFEVLNERRGSGRQDSSFAPVRMISDELQIGGTRLRLAMADEDAKLNVNQIYQYKGLAGTDSTLKRMWPPLAGVSQQLRPAIRNEVMQTADANRAPIPTAFESWGQVYAIDDARAELRSRFLSATADRMTCWGRPQLNYRNCDDSSLLEVLKLVLNAQRATSLADQIRANPRLDIQAMMVSGGADQSTRKKVAKLLTRVSACFSLQAEILPQSAETRGRSYNLTSVAILELSTLDNEGTEDFGTPVQFYRYLLH